MRFERYMNILFLSELFYPHGGGAELATHLYASLLSQSDTNVKVITNLFGGEKERSRSGKMEIIRIPLLRSPNTMKHSLLWSFPFQLSEFFRECIQWADVVYIPLYWYSAIPIAKAYGKPVVIHLHNYILTCPLGTLYNFSNGTICQRRKRYICPANCILAHEKTSARKTHEVLTSTLLNSAGRDLIWRLASVCDALICVSEAQKQLTVQTCVETLERKLHVLYNPIPDFEYIKLKGADIGYFGGYNRLKGFNVLYNAANLLNSCIPRKVSIHGTKLQGVSESGKAVLMNKGFILHGKLDQFHYRKLYQQLRAVVVPSIWHEPYGYVVTEALLRGRIVIASKIGGIPEITKGCLGVRLFAAGNHEQLAEEISYVKELASEDVVNLGIKNRESIQKKFNNERIVKSFKSILAQVM